MTPYSRPDKARCDDCGGVLATPVDIGHALCHDCRHSEEGDA
jgi:hypothetical protein